MLYFVLQNRSSGFHLLFWFCTTSLRDWLTCTSRHFDHYPMRSKTNPIVTLAHVFPRFVLATSLLGVLIGSFTRLWTTAVMTSVLVLRHSFANRCTKICSTKNRYSSENFTWAWCASLTHTLLIITTGIDKIDFKVISPCYIWNCSRQRVSWRHLSSQDFCTQSLLSSFYYWLCTWDKQT